MKWKRYTVRNRYPPREGEPCTCLAHHFPVCVKVNYARLRNGDSSRPGSKAGDDVSRLRRSNCRMETFEC